MLSWPVRQAARIVQRGGVIAYPTETVYGLGCDPLSYSAIQTLLAIKQRPVEKGLILLASQPKQLFEFINLSPLTQQALEMICDTPTTWVVPAAKLTPLWLTGGRSTLAVRVSTHPTVQALCQCTGFPLVSTSANRRGESPIQHIYSLRTKIGHQVDAIVPGNISRYANPSRIVDVLSGQVIRSS